MSKDDLDNFEEQEMKKIRSIKRNWFDWLIKQRVVGKKPKIISVKLKDKIINDIRTLFEKKEKKDKYNERIINDRIIKDIRTLSEQHEEDYHKPERVSNFWNNRHIEYESNDDKNRNLSLDEHLNKI